MIGLTLCMRSVDVEQFLHHTRVLNHDLMTIAEDQEEENPMAASDIGSVWESKSKVNVEYWASTATTL